MSENTCFKVQDTGNQIKLDRSVEMHLKQRKPI